METRELFEVAVREHRAVGAAMRARAGPGTDLLAAVDRRRRRRQARRAAAVCVLAAAIVFLARPGGERPRPSAAPDARPGLLTFVRDDPMIVARLTAPPRLASIEIVRTTPIAAGHLLDDRGLVAWLHRAGRPRAVVRTGTDVRLSAALE